MIMTNARCFTILCHANVLVFLFFFFASNDKENNIISQYVMICEISVVMQNLIDFPNIFN